jgi:hypothetical protein
MNYSASSPVWNVQKAARVTKAMNDDGVILEQKVPQNPNHCILLNPAGNTVFVPLSNGPAIRGSTQYGVQLMLEKLAAGFLPWNECPVARGHVKLDGKSCEGKDGRGNLDAPCRHLLEVQEKRREHHERKEIEFGSRMKTNDDLTAQYMRLKIKEDMDAAAATPGKVGAGKGMMGKKKELK